MKPGRIVIIVAGAFLTGAEAVQASNGSGMGAGGAILELIGLVLASGCFLLSWKVLACVRGGRMAAAWQWLTSATFLFAAGQALAFVAYLALISVAGEVVLFLRILALVLLFLGMIRMRKALA